jgi:hypothetical protein
LRSDGIYVRQVREQLYHRNDSLSQMRNELDKAFWHFSMQLCDLQVERRSDFLALDALETFVEF